MYDILHIGVGTKIHIEYYSYNFFDNYVIFCKILSFFLFHNRYFYSKITLPQKNNYNKIPKISFVCFS